MRHKEKFTPVANSTSELKALHALPDAEVPPEHQDDKEVQADARRAEERKQKRRKRMKIGAAAATAIAALPVAATAYFVYEVRGASDATGPQDNPGTSAPEVPGQQNEQAPSDLLDSSIETIATDQDPALVQHYFDTAISPIISARAGAENADDIDDSDLAGISGGEDVPSLSSFVDKVTSDLQYARTDQKKNGTYGFVPNVAVSSDTVSSTETPDGGFEVEANLRYFAIDDQGQPNGYIVGNKDSYVFTYVPKTLEFSDGTSKDVMVIASIEKATETQ